MKLLILPLAPLLSYSARKAPSIALKGTVILAYEKHSSKPMEKARFTIADTVKLTVSYPKNEVAITSCIGSNGASKQYFVLLKADKSGKKYLSDVRRVWDVDTQGHLV